MPNDADPDSPKTSRLAIAAFTVAAAGVALWVVAAVAPAESRGEWYEYIMYSGGVAATVGVVAIFEVALRSRTHGGMGYAAMGMFVGMLNSGLAFVTLMSGATFHGRPLRLHGRSAAAPTTAAGEWADGPTPDVAGLAPALRAELGAQWLQDAREEHASVPAFALLSLHLTRLAAPPELVMAAHRAALDEVAHARRCFALAAAYLGRPCGPASWPALASAAREVDLVTLACEALADGCVGEGAAAEIAAAAAVQARDPVVRAVLVDIARDEGEHAALAWDVLAWALAAGCERVERAVTACARRLSAEPIVARCGVDLGAHGRLSASDAWVLRGRVVAAAQVRLAALLPATRAA